jgi:ABC-type branched-subunit amino acid transport system ATPase component
MVIDFGKKVIEGNPNEIMNSSVVQELYTGIS